MKKIKILLEMNTRRVSSVISHENANLRIYPEIVAEQNWFAFHSFIHSAQMHFYMVEFLDFQHVNTNINQLIFILIRFKHNTF